MNSSPGTAPPSEGPGSTSGVSTRPPGAADAFSGLAADVPVELSEGFAEVGDVRLHYVEAGDEPLVVSAARLYWENKAGFFDAKDITIPFAITGFPDERYRAPRSWAARAYPNNLIHYNRVDRGGHFAAWEQPQIFCEELRAAFSSLRT